MFKILTSQIICQIISIPEIVREVSFFKRMVYKIMYTKAKHTNFQVVKMYHRLPKTTVKEVQPTRVWTRKHSKSNKCQVWWKTSIWSPHSLTLHRYPEGIPRSGWHRFQILSRLTKLSRTLFISNRSSSRISLWIWWVRKSNSHSSSNSFNSKTKSINNMFRVVSSN